MQHLATLASGKANMDTLKELVALGKELGLDGEDLKSFVSDQQNQQREDRQRERERKKEEDELALDRESRRREEEEARMEADHRRRMQEAELQLRIEMLRQEERRAVQERTQVSQALSLATRQKLP